MTLKDGSQLDTQHFILATGPLHVPSIPNIPGLNTFKGKQFHSAQWDHDYDLKYKNIVSIGTGGSAVQYLPEIAPIVKKLSAYPDGISIKIGRRALRLTMASVCRGTRTCFSWLDQILV